jgi:peptidoglycan hydrolase-like protein with peptidoglycan-binding domain
MSLIPAPIPLGAIGPQVTALQKSMIALGFTFPPNEAGSALANGTFGPGTQAAINVFRQRMGLPAVAPNITPFDASTARLLNVVVPANTTDGTALDAAVRESVTAAQGAAPVEVEWLARYATIARDFAAARQAAALAPTDPVVATVVQPVIGDANLQTPNPELQNPENYYTCRYDFVPQDALDSLLGRPVASDARLRMARRRPAQRDGSEDWPDVPSDVPDPPPPDPDPHVSARSAAIEASALSWAQAVDFWQKGHREFKQQRYASAVSNYDEAVKSAVGYFENFYNLPGPRESVSKRIGQIVAKFAGSESSFPGFWEIIRRRRTALTLTELQEIDWSGYEDSRVDKLLHKNLNASTDPEQKPTPQNPTPWEDNYQQKSVRQQVLDRFALLLAAVFVPLARSEANRMLRFYSDAITDLQRVQAPFLVALPILFLAGAPEAEANSAPRPEPLPGMPAAAKPPGIPALTIPTPSRPVWLTCDFIERPFVQLALAETLFERGETEYKSDAPADPTLPALPIVANEKPGDWPRRGNNLLTDPFCLRLGSCCPLIFIRELLRLFAACHFRSYSPSASVVIAKTGYEISRLRMLPDASHV